MRSFIPSVRPFARLSRALVYGTGVLWLGGTAAALANETYDVDYKGAPNGLTPKLKILSSVEQKKRTFPTRTALRRAARNDVRAFEGALKASGYYAGTVSFMVEASDSEKPKLIFTIEPGEAFAINNHQIVYEVSHDENRPQNFAQAGLEVTGKADGATLLANQRTFLNYLWENGYPAARIIGRSAEADLATSTATVTYTFNSGPRAVFGDAVITGLTRTNENYIRKLITWEPGDIYEKGKSLSFRDRLAGTNLFNGIDVTPGTTEPDGTTPILAALTERKHRTIGAGVAFSTSEGPGARVFFENRNLFHRGESLRVDLEVSQIEQSARFILEKPIVTLPGSVFVQGSFRNETTDAFNASTIDLAGGVLKSWFDEQLETRGGLAFETSDIRPIGDGIAQRTFFFSLPLSATWNNEDDLLNPTKGVRASLLITPYTGSETFTQFDSQARTRFAFGKDKKFITAFRARLGGTVGNSFEDLPLNQRFFSGGGGSVRGFGFQQAGPVDIVMDDVGEISNVIPTGGRSLIEGAFEARYAITNTIQLAGFVDAGSVSESALPDFSEDFFIGVGGGVRYLTPVGPLRVDIGIPVNPRPFDNPVQFLISLGQAF